MFFSAGRHSAGPVARAPRHLTLPPHVLFSARLNRLVSARGPPAAAPTHLCSPIIFSIQIMLYQRPNLYPHRWKVPTFV